MSTFEPQVLLFAQYAVAMWQQLRDGASIVGAHKAEPCPFELGEGDASDEALDCAATRWRFGAELSRRRFTLVVQRLFGAPLGMNYEGHTNAVINSIESGSFEDQTLGLHRCIGALAFDEFCDAFNVEVRDPCRTKGTGEAGERSVQEAVRLGVNEAAKKKANACFRRAAATLSPHLQPLVCKFEPRKAAAQVRSRPERGEANLP